MLPARAVLDRVPPRPWKSVDSQKAAAQRSRTAGLGEFDARAYVDVRALRRSADFRCPFVMIIQKSKFDLRNEEHSIHF